MKSMALSLLLLGISFALTGCITCEECGSLKIHHDIARLFLNNEIVPGYNYFYSGTSQWPSAIMAIDASYTVKAEFWKPVELSGQDLSEWLQKAANWNGLRRTNKNGAEILSPEGERVGIFFSKYDNLITKFQGNKVIQVYPPSYLAGRGGGSGGKDNN